MIIEINGHGQSFYFKQTQLVVYKFDTICKAFKENPFLYFEFEDFKALQFFNFQWD